MAVKMWMWDRINVEWYKKSRLSTITEFIFLRSKPGVSKCDKFAACYHDVRFIQYYTPTHTLITYYILVYFFFYINHLTPNDHFSGRTAPLTSRSCIFLFIQQIYVLNILNMLHTLHFFLFKMPFIS